MRVSILARRITKIYSRLLNSDARYLINALKSEVQLPELLGWKKLSVDIIILAKESKALQPARYVFGEARVSLAGVFVSGHPNGVDAPDFGSTGPSLVIDQTIIFARESVTRYVKR